MKLKVAAAVDPYRPDHPVFSHHESTNPAGGLGDRRRKYRGRLPGGPRRPIRFSVNVSNPGVSDQLQAIISRALGPTTQFEEVDN